MCHFPMLKMYLYIYNKGRTIDPADIFQQTTRTRNINKLYYYSEVKAHEPIYNSIEDECRNINLILTTTTHQKKYLKYVALVIVQTMKSLMKTHFLKCLYTMNT